MSTSCYARQQEIFKIGYPSENIEGILVYVIRCSSYSIDYHDIEQTRRDCKSAPPRALLLADTFS